MVKTYNNLFDEIASYENVRAAIFEAARHKRKKASVRKALACADELAAKISNWLKNDEWRPVKVHNCTLINDGINLKKRLIVCPEFTRDQIVHHAIMRVVYKYLAKKFYTYSCGSVKGKGSEFAIEKKIRAETGTTKYAVQIDIKKFFNSVRPSFVFKALRRTIRDKKALWLMARVLRNNVVRVNKDYLQLTEGLTVIKPVGKNRVLVKGGLPIGFYTSPIFANVLLSELDHYVKEKLQASVYVRYMDDILIFSSNKRKLKNICAKINEYLGKIRLRLKREPAVHKFGSQSPPE